MTIKVTALGVGDAFSARYYSSCLLVQADGYTILVDCPHPIRKILQESAPGVDIPDIDAVVLTHLHADHCSGLEPFAFFCHFVLGRPAALVAHPVVLRRLWSDCLAAGMDQLIGADGKLQRKTFEHYFAATHLDLGAPVHVGPFEISCRMTKHHIPTTALRLRVGDRSLGYSADTSFDPSLIAWLAEADLVIHETNLGTHTPYGELRGLPEATREKLRLIHYTDFFDLETSEITPMVQGEPIEIN